LGNTLELLIRKLLPPFLYNKVHYEGCGCDERKEWLNNQHRKIIDWWRWKMNNQY